MIARDWNVPISGVGYVTRFRVRRALLGRSPTHGGGRPATLTSSRGCGRKSVWVPSKRPLAVRHWTQNSLPSGSVIT